MWKRIALALVLLLFFKPVRVVVPEWMGLTCVSEQICIEQPSDQTRATKLYAEALTYVNTQVGQLAAVSGFRFVEYLAWGRALYVDDLVTASSARKLGLAGQLLDHLIELAKASGCQQFHLDSGVQRHDAHRLYLGRKLQISSHHFSLELAPHKY